MNRFDWAKWSAIAELFGAIAILCTLAYLDIQTRYLAEQREQNMAAVVPVPSSASFRETIGLDP